MMMQSFIVVIERVKNERKMKENIRKRDKGKIPPDHCPE
jgi:hypothetical protein